MTRRKIPNDTDTFHYHNENPRNIIAEDCAIRAISLATELTWDEVYKGLAETGFKLKREMSEDITIQKYLESLGWERCKQPRKTDNTKFTGSEFCDVLPVDHSPIIANIGSYHVTCIKNNKIWDSWNSSHGCIQRYYQKKEKMKKN